GGGRPHGGGQTIHGGQSEERQEQRGGEASHHHRRQRTLDVRAYASRERGRHHAEHRYHDQDELRPELRARALDDGLGQRRARLAPPRVALGHVEQPTPDGHPERRDESPPG